jgi:hypothetical protein
MLDDILYTFLTGLLFFILVPGILFTIPKNGSKWTVACLHALVFFAICLLINWIISGSIFGVEGFSTKKKSTKKKKTIVKKYPKKKVIHQDTTNTCILKNGKKVTKPSTGICPK